jgi:DUF4097 and DUF4098 domain-containing protein YvlB
MPPGGTPPPPYPPYDPKTQWRIYREQQKAAWRAQRHAMKANYAGVYGPRVPSVVGPVILIGIGVVALLVVTNRIAVGDFWSWYGRWWPLLLIGAGLALLGEWALDLRRKTPVRRGGSFVGLLILLAIMGFAAAGWNHMNPWFSQWNNNNNGDFFNAFGLPEHDYDQQILNQQIAANASIDIENPRGDVSVTADDSSTVQVQAHEVAYARSDEDAKKIFDAEMPHPVVSGNAVLIKSVGSNSGRLDLVVTVPKAARVTVNASHGDVTASGLGAGITIDVAHGDTHLSAISGPVQARFSGGKHDFFANQVTGDLTLEGNSSDMTFSEIKGRINVNGEIFGEVHMENISGPIKLHTSVTDLQVTALPGDLALDSDELRVTEATGALHVVTHSKDIDLNQIYGDVYVENRTGSISVEPAGVYSVEARNSKGDVELTLPPNASANVNGRTHNGDIVSDFGLAISGDESKTVNGRIGSGSSRIVLNTENGDLRLKKGPAFPAKPPLPNAVAAPESPAAPAPPNARHLKAHKSLPAQPVTQ